MSVSQPPKQADATRSSLATLLKRWLRRFTLIDLLAGLKITGREFFKKKITVQYPEEKTPYGFRHRGALALRRYDNGEERCIACKLCEAVCPALAITIEADEREDGSRRTTRFDIDVFKCINCGLCERACPVDSIVLVPDMNYAIRERGENIFTKEKLLTIGDHYESQLQKDRQDDADYR